LPEAARLGDPITHTNALTGLLVGLFVGAVAGVAFGLVTVLSGGTALALLPAVIAVVGAASTGASIGATICEAIGTFSTHPAGALNSGEKTVLIGGMMASRAMADTAACTDHSPPPAIAQGSATVWICCRPAARKDDKGECSFVISAGCTTVLLGGAQTTYLTMSGEVPLKYQLLVLGLGIFGPGAWMRIVNKLTWGALSVRIGAGLVGGFGLSYVGSLLGGRWYGEGSPGQKAVALGFGWLGSSGASWGAGKIYSNLGGQTFILPPKTASSTQAVDVINEAIIKYNQTAPEVAQIVPQNNQVITATTHADGTVTYSLSGKYPSHIYAKLQALLPKEYRPQLRPADLSAFKPVRVGNKILRPRPCAEPNCLMGGQNTSPVTGMTTRWRGIGDNPFAIEPGSPYMSPCKGCARNAGVMQGLTDPAPLLLPPLDDQSHQVDEVGHAPGTSCCEAAWEGM